MKEISFLNYYFKNHILPLNEENLVEQMKVNLMFMWNLQTSHVFNVLSDKYVNSLKINS